MSPFFVLLLCVVYYIMFYPTCADGATWMTFKLTHVLNPETTEGRNHASWTVGNWTTWLYTREILQDLERDSQKLSSSRKPMYEKAKNTVILANPQEILDSFSGNRRLFKSMKYMDDLFWSNVEFPLYHIESSGQSHAVTVYVCGLRFVIVSLQNDRFPKHLERWYHEVIENYTGNLQPNLVGCNALRN